MSETLFAAQTSDLRAYGGYTQPESTKCGANHSGNSGKKRW